jgi:hypothetical protein
MAIGREPVSQRIEYCPVRWTESASLEAGSRSIDSFYYLVVHLRISSAGFDYVCLTNLPWLRLIDVEQHIITISTVLVKILFAAGSLFFGVADGGEPSA